MAHNITERDGMFTVREAAWHGLGEVLQDYPTRQAAQELAHPWEPISEPVYRRVPVLHEHDPGCYRGGWSGQNAVDYDRTLVCERPVLVDQYEEIEDAQAIVRSDNGTTLGVVSGTYEPVKNAEMYDIAEAIEGEAKGSVRFETGGSLKGGRKVWLLIRLNEPLVLRDDKITATIPYYALQNAHDGSGSFRGQSTLTRIVCDNTSQLADMDAQARGTEFVFRHTANVRDRIEEAQNALAGWREGLQQWRLQQEVLLARTVTPHQEREFVERFIPMPPPHAVSDRVVNNVDTARDQLQGIIRGETLEGVHGTAYGLVQASVEYLNHARKARSAETRFKRNYLDRDRIVTDAVELVREVAYV